MQNQQLPSCPNCGKTAQLAQAAFCPFCGTAMNAPQAAAVPAGAKELLQKAEAAQDPRKKHEWLLKAQQQYPDCLEIEAELLFLGRLHERNPKNISYSVIKCYLFALYLTPADFTQPQQAQMREELFAHPQLKRCQSLAPNAERFTQKYLERLAEEFVRLFLRGSSRYMRSFMGISIDGRAPKLLAEPTYQMLANIRKDEALLPAQREQLYNALYAGFSQQMSGDTHWLDEKLSAQGYVIPAKP
ncbi:MAG: hypothetical protein RR865_09815 [Clostridia bacterium]